MKIDIGSGREPREGYIGVDLHPDEGVKFVCDVVKNGLPFLKDEVEAINMSHFLEHVPIHSVNYVLKECYRVLKPGGVIEVVVPDLIWCLESFMKAEEKNRWGIGIFFIYGRQDREGEEHKCGFSREKLIYEMNKVGFTTTICMPVNNHEQQCLYAKASK